jgi:predicted PurR-regulated permease PerM
MRAATDSSGNTRQRVVFLLLLALGITILFYWLIKSFLLALLVAAVLAGIAHPFYRRVLGWLGGRRRAAAGLTVLLSILLVIIPMLLFLGILVGEAVSISESAGEWVSQKAQASGGLKKQIGQDSNLKQLLPYQDEILAKAGELAGKMGTFVAKGLAVGAKGTAELFFMLFIMVYALFYFLTDGRSILNSVLRFTPLLEDEKEKLLGTFVSVGRATLKGTVIIGIVQGGLAGLSFWVAGIEGAVFWGAVMCVLSIVPGVGTALVWVPAVIFLALDGQIVQAVGVGLWCGLVVGTADNLLRPLLVGRDTQMPDLLVTLTTLGGLALLGPAGIIVGPIIGALYMTVWQLWGGAVEERGPAAATGEVPAKGRAQP